MGQGWKCDFFFFIMGPKITTICEIELQEILFRPVLKRMVFLI